MIAVLHGLDAFTEADLEAFKKHLTPQRLEKTESLRFLPDKIASACAFLLLKVVAFRHFGGCRMKFAFTETGKPYFPDRPDMRFSISHDRTGACVIVSDSDVGADAQSLIPYEDALARRILTERELSFADKRDETYLTRVWTMKECLGKRTGEGVYAILSKTDFSNVRGDAYYCIGDAFYWSKRIDDTLYAAVSSSGERAKIWSKEEFVSALEKLPTDLDDLFDRLDASARETGEDDPDGTGEDV